MALKDLTPREILLGITGFAIAQLLIMTGDRFYGREYGRGTLFLAMSTVLALVFFRKRKIALVISALSWVLVVGALTVPFHPNRFAWTLTIASAAGLYVLIRWSAKRYPYLRRKHIHKVFEGESAMDAENERIKVEGRELG